MWYNTVCVLLYSVEGVPCRTSQTTSGYSAPLGILNYMLHNNGMTSSSVPLIILGIETRLSTRTISSNRKSQSIESNEFCLFRAFGNNYIRIETCLSTPCNDSIESKEPVERVERIERLLFIPCLRNNYMSHNKGMTSSSVPLIILLRDRLI